MKDEANTDVLELIGTQAKFRGLAAGCAYAEGFCRLGGYQRGLAGRVLP
ncbi:hypothetical protein [Niabella drilacis]|uniref:Uncharacterized protein n=1 Tax=Niabella drilacis (strain DSM 25811 / CCM 8410 / CCUG 62505 / LMG 26954 / E90) TaxID=1285928 RepID=A0A1G6R2B1_NIADE|nr:hypothetical protein [Niabella drilacis]SDC98157.1 hypothetical protein SAMN04487894_10599 [Niabella drilacis]